MGSFKDRVWILVMAVCFVGKSQALAQDYRIESISPILGSNETALMTDGDSKILGSQYSDKGEHLFIYDWKKMTKVLIKNFSITTPRGVNRSGVVIGSLGETQEQTGHENSEVRAVVWRKKNGGQILPYLTAGDNTSEALSINNRGKIVGYSGNHNSENSALDVYRAFIYDLSRAKMKEITFPAAQSWIATSINDAGEILVFRVDGDSPQGAIVREDGTVLHRFVPGSSFYFYPTGSILGEQHLLSADKFSTGETLYDLKNNHSWTPGASIPLGRADYGTGSFFNRNGSAVGYRSGIGFFSKSNFEDLPIQCLVPRNQSLPSGKHMLTAASLEIESMAGIDSKENIVFNAGNAIFLARRITTKSNTFPKSYCPSLSAKLECECVTENGRSQSCVTSGKFRFQNSDDLGVVEALRTGGKCSLSLSTQLKSKEIPLIPVKLEGSVGEICTVEIFNKRIGARPETLSLKTGRFVNYYLSFHEKSFPHELWLPQANGLSLPYDPTTESPAGCFIN